MTGPNVSHRRRVELGLLLLAVLVVAGAYTLATLGRTAEMPANIGPFLGIVVALFLGAHVATRRLAPAASPVLVPVVALLNGLGYVMIARLNQQLAAQQAAWTAVGMVGFCLTLAILRRVRTLEGLRYTAGLAGIVLLVLPLLPGIGVAINGARIWTRIGPVSFQPGEFAKLAFAVFFAGYLVERRELLAMATFRLGPIVMPEPRHLAPLAAAWGMSMIVVIFEKDLGSALLFFVLVVAMLWVATERAAYVVIGGLLFAAGSVFTWSNFAHVQTRVSMWLDPWTDPLGRGYQIIQAQFALAWGGSGGTGLGRGIPGRIPYQETDFIFAVIGEELGVFGAAAVLMAYLLIAAVGFGVAVRANDAFSKLLATGLTTLLAVQSFIIMAGVTRLLPLTGVTLPFVSYGGSSLVANWMLVALLVRISHESADLPVGSTDATSSRVAG
jgi:peptidoglycan glycosyltransferase